MWTLGDTEFEYFRNIVYRESGIRLTELKKALVQARLTKRLRQLKINSFTEYCDYVKHNYYNEIENLINCITTNKTDFFREARHFEFIKQYLIPQWCEKKKRRIRIWSAGCSTGEEPYSIAIILREHFQPIDVSDVKILATDIDTEVIEKGKRGIYSADAVADVPRELATKYFLKGKGTNEGLFKIKDIVKNMVYFRKLNLLDEKYPMKGKFDLIFCRNVIIYFDRETQRMVFDKFYEYIENDGFLFVGHSETLTGLTSKFALVTNSIYRKVV
ncbi:MAG: protein-glutamate O-methyltransferase CheR [Spirochaetes bacterium]|nr:protein-glutamate O-methyltransferase CheR [Spirochaetota bacterium]